MSQPDRVRTDTGDGWDAGWEGHALAQRRRIAALPLWVRIDWLEETQRLVMNLREGRRGPVDADPE
ncbi:MAG: hypothetical protein ABIP29_05465 [Candidatus Eisenbacteria bacterium]